MINIPFITVTTLRKKREKDRWELGGGPQGNFSCNSKFSSFKNRVSWPHETVKVGQ